MGIWELETLLATVKEVHRFGFGTIYCGDGDFGLAGVREKSTGGRVLEFRVPLITKPILVLIFMDY